MLRYRALQGFKTTVKGVKGVTSETIQVKKFFFPRNGQISPPQSILCILVPSVYGRWTHSRALSQPDVANGEVSGLCQTVKSRQPATTADKAGRIISMLCLDPKLGRVVNTAPIKPLRSQKINGKTMHGSAPRTKNCNSPWRMTVNSRELNKAAFPIHMQQ